MGKRHGTADWDRRRHGNKRGTAGERIAFVRATWEKEPHVSVNGSDGMQDRLVAKFGTTVPDRQLLGIRAQVIARKKAQEQTETRPTLATVPEAFAALAAPALVKPEPWAAADSGIRPAPALPTPKPIELRPAPEPEPELQPEPEEDDDMTFPKKGDFDVALGSSKRSTAGRKERMRYVAELITAKPAFSNHEIDERVEKVFGMKAHSDLISVVRKKVKIFPAKSTSGQILKVKFAKSILRKNPGMQNEELQALIVEQFGHALTPKAISGARKDTKTTRADQSKRKKAATKAAKRAAMPTNPPGAPRSINAVKKRAIAEAMLRDGHSSEQIQSALLEQFDKGIGHGALAKLRSQIKKPGRKSNGVAHANPTSSDRDSIMASIEMMLEAVPGLYELRLETTFDNDSGAVVSRQLNFKVDAGESIEF